MLCFGSLQFDCSADYYTNFWNPESVPLSPNNFKLGYRLRWGGFEEQSSMFWARSSLEGTSWKSRSNECTVRVYLDWPARLRSISAFSDKRLPGLHGSDSIVACSTLVFIFDSSACFCVVLIYVCHLICTCSCEVRQGLFSIICYKCLKPRHNHDWHSR